MKTTNTFSHYKMNFQLGMFSFITHRITGIMLIIFIILFLLFLSVFMFGKLPLEKALSILSLPFFRIMGFVFYLTLFWHVLNGLKILIIDLFKAGRLHKPLTLMAIAVFLLGSVLYAIEFFSGTGAG